MNSGVFKALQNGESFAAKIYHSCAAIENTTSKTQPIRPVIIVLRKRNGAKLMRLRHKTRQSILKLGAKTRFSSTIPYDKHGISDIEATIEN